MSVFALNTCQEANGVSLLHGRVSQEMFAPVWKGFFPEELHVGYVTNGVHLPTWASAEWQELYTKHFGKDFIKKQTEEATWAKIQQLPQRDDLGERTRLSSSVSSSISAPSTARSGSATAATPRRRYPSSKVSTPTL